MPDPATVRVLRRRWLWIAYAASPVLILLLGAFTLLKNTTVGVVLSMGGSVTVILVEGFALERLQTLSVEMGRMEHCALCAERDAPHLMITAAQ